jgi:hypothetical protein
MKKQLIHRASFAMIAAMVLSLPLISFARAEDGVHKDVPITKDHGIRDEDRGVRKDRLYDTTRPPQECVEPRPDKMDRDHRD